MGKKFILMRHGHAYKELSARGQAQAADIARQLANAKLVPETIIHSPVSRAQQTARKLKETFAQLTGRNIPMLALPWLKLGHQTTEADIISLSDNFALAQNTTILSVTHEMNFMELAAEFGFNASPSNAETHVFMNKTARNWNRFCSTQILRMERFRPA